MPIGGTKDGDITFGINLNVDQLTRGLAKVQEQVVKENKEFGKFGKILQKSLVPFKKVYEFSQKRVKADKEYLALQQKLGDEIKGLDANIAKAHRAMSGADDKKIASLKKQISEWKALKEAREKASKAHGEDRAAGSKTTKALDFAKGADKAAGAFAGEFAAKAAKPFSALAGKDILGSIEAGGELAGFAIEKSFKASAALFRVTSKFMGKTMGDKLWAGAKSQWKKGGVKGVAGAGAATLGAGAMKGLGGAMKGMEKASAGMAAMGPALTASVGILMQLVKVMLDAESAAKEFNKDLLSAASTSEFLADAGGDSQKAFQDLAGTVESIRKSATDAGENLAWGINKKTHLEFLNTLNAEGVSLKRIDDDAKAAGLSVGDFSAEMVHVGVAYSRNFGVSLSEIGTMQGEMMREMGLGLEGVKDQFAMMSQAASESGIASNKFFAIMRGMSADLSLFNLRLEDAVGTLKLLGKAMSPKNAEAFLKTLTSFYKGQDLQSRIKATLLGGGAGATKQRLQKDVKVRIDSMARQVEEKLGPGKGEEMKKAIKGGSKTTAEFLAQNQKAFAGKDMGGMKEAIYDAQRMQSKLTRGGLIDVASALKDASPETTMKQLDAIAKVAGAQDVEHLTDVQMLAFQSMSGVSDDQLDMLIKAKAGITQVREDLVAQLKQGFSTLSPEQQEIAKKLGISSNSAEDIAKAQKMSNDQVWGVMTSDQKRIMQGGMQQIDYAKRQTELTSGLGDKLDAILDALFEYIYSITKDILDDLNEFMQLVGKWLGKPEKKDSDRRTRRSQMETLRQKGDPTSMGILKAMKEPGGLAKLIGERLDASKGVTEQRKAQAQQMAYDEATAKNLEGMERQMYMETRMMQSGLNMVAPEIKDALESLAQKGDMIKGPEAVSGVTAAMKASGFDDSKTKFLTDQLAQGKSLYDAIRIAQLSPEQITALTKGMASTMGESKVADAATYMKALEVKAPEKPAEGAEDAGPPTPPTTEAKPPSAQSTASAPPGTTPAPGAPATAPAAPAPGTTAPGGQTVNLPEVKVTAEAATTTAEHTQKTAAILENVDSKQGEIVKALTGLNPKGVVLGDPKTQFSEAVEKSVLKAMQQALFEYFLYSGNEDDVNKVLEMMTKGSKDPTKGADLAGMMLEQAQTGKVATGVKGKSEEAEPKASGGYVVDTSGTMARIIRQPPGEAFTSIGKGERILPAGAGGGGGGGGSIKVELSFKDGMERFVEAKTLDTVYENTRRSRMS